MLKGIIKNETVAFYIGKTYLFVKNCGIDEERLRFRQHLSEEMAHYADDCWDLECKTSYGWIECAGIADRCDYDLKKHSEYSGQKLTFEIIKENSKEEIIPHVIEPSFGIARIMYTILEHTFRVRANDSQRSVREFSLFLIFNLFVFFCQVLFFTASDFTIQMCCDTFS